MHFAKFLSALALLAAPVASQNITFITEFLQELERLGLTSLANVSTVINATTPGQALLAELGSGPLTVFAPNNNAWAGALPNITSNPDLLADVLSYHILPGTFNTTPTYPNTTVGRTLLNSSDLVFLEGGKRQVLAWSDVNGTVSILNQNTPAVVTNSTTVGNLTLHVTSAVIDVPGDLSAALSANSLTQFTSAAQSAGLLDTLNTTHGVTIFAPSDEAFARAQQALSSAGSNETVVSNILRNHVISGTSLYSGNLIGLGSDNNVTTSGGQGLSASFNSTGGYVTVGNTTAAITKPDIILWSGALHIIDTVLLDDASNSEAASSAASSASEAATSSATESGPIGFTQSATSSGSQSTAITSSASLDVPLRFARATGLFGAAVGGAFAL